ncbi:MAG: response regulator [Caulobacteraceae bacterium]|nr:response regulator [Caulobacteraceae bacterium]
MCHVLIIEDDAIAALDIQTTLAEAGATSFAFAASIREAVQAARELPPALITADVMISDGSGLEAVRTIQAEFGPLPVIFITATPDQCEGPEPVIEKPFRTEELAAVFSALAPPRSAPPRA